MKLNFKHDRLMAVVAHPDDAELLCAGTLARARADGAAIAACVLCRGDKGQSAVPVRNLAAVRRKEMQAAAGMLGAQLFLCGQPDGFLSDSARTRQQLTEVLRKFKPTLVLAHAPEDYHPDHQAAAALAEAATLLCASHGHKTKSPALKTSPALWWMDTLGMSAFEPAFFINITDFVPQKTQLLACHASQLARGRDADFSPLGELMRLQMRTRGMQSGVEAAEAFRAHNVFKRARAW